jgi:predicted membrane-bound mannosyltransferase
MFATKETFVLSLAAAALALLANLAWRRTLDASQAPLKTPPLNFTHLAGAAGACLLVWLVLFSSFFSNPAGLWDSFRTYVRWMQRAAGDSPHLHPWYFYWQRLLWFHPTRGPVWTELLVFVLALVGAASGFARRRFGQADAAFIRFLSFFAFALAAVYSLLPYKTPWCLLGFWQGMLLLAGAGAAALSRWLKPRVARVALALVLVAGAGHLAWQAWEGGTEYAADRRNPYVYAQTSPDLLDLVAQIESLASAQPEGQNLLIKVMAEDGDYWPLPWYLRNFKRVGWWSQLPDAPLAPVMVISPQFHNRLAEAADYEMAGFFQLRPNVFLELCVQKNLWQAWMNQRARAQPSPGAAGREK